jgi:hypothetical protein
VGSSAHENKPWLDKYAGYAPEELSLPEGSMAYFLKESVRRVPDVDASRRFDETISYSELNDFADRFATLPTPRGVEKGGKVTCYAQDNPQFLIARGLRILDRAVHYHGGGGVSKDFPLANLWAVSRSPAPRRRPDEVHRAAVANEEGVRGEPGDREGEGRVERSRRLRRR